VRHCPACTLCAPCLNPSVHGRSRAGVGSVRRRPGLHARTLMKRPRSSAHRRDSPPARRRRAPSPASSSHSRTCSGRAPGYAKIRKRDGTSTPARLTDLGAAHESEALRDHITRRSREARTAMVFVARCLPHGPMRSARDRRLTPVLLARQSRRLSRRLRGVAERLLRRRSGVKTGGCRSAQPSRWTGDYRRVCPEAAADAGSRAAAIAAPWLEKEQRGRARRRSV
jgi:hypothetical protein